MKYKTAACALKDKNGDFYFLKDQKAENIAMYLFWKDVHRLEYFSLLDDKLINGYAIFLTNEGDYKGEANKDNLRKDFEFDRKNWIDDHISSDSSTNMDGRLLSWRDKNGNASTKKGYEKPIHIEGNYKDDLRWNAYSILQEVKDYKGFDKKSAGKFDYLVVSVRCDQIRDKLQIKGCDLFTSSFIKRTADAYFSKAIINKARKGGVEVFDFMRGQYKIVEDVNCDKYKLPEDSCLREKVDVEIKLLGKYYEKNQDFLNFIGQVKKNEGGEKSQKTLRMRSKDCFSLSLCLPSDQGEDQR